MTRLLEKIGIYRGRKDPAVLFIGATAAAFAEIADLVDGFCQSKMRLDVVLLCLKKSDCDNVGRRFALANVIARPLGGVTAFAGLLSTLKVRVVVAAGDLPENFKTAIIRKSTPLVIAQEVTGKPVGQGINEIIKLAGRERDWRERKNRPAGRFFADKIHAGIVANQGRTGWGGKIQRIETFDQLATRLGNPLTIMCLGNGPSSEDKQLAGMAHDVLFRANHVWMKRGYLDRPDMVFTGMQASMKKVKNVIFGVLGDTTEKVLLMVRAKNFFMGRLEYCVVGGSSELVAIDALEDFRPTSGAIMLLVAVALQPEILIVAGMDMFRHPDGAYPGDPSTSNAYTATHDHDHELGFILKQLDRFEGELQIVSPVLAAEWQSHQNSKG